MSTKLKIKSLKNIFLFVAVIFAVGSLSSCEDELTEQEQAMAFVGTWKQTSRAVDGTVASLDSTHMVLQIDSINICVLYDSSYTAVISNKVVTRSGWSYTNGLFNIAVDLPASYTVEAGSNELTMDRVDFSPSGEILKTRLEFHRIASIDQE